MSEMSGSFQVPAEQTFDTEAYQGSMQQVLQENIGTYVVVDFLIGTQNLVSKQGLLYTVGAQFIVLFDEESRQYVVCDIFAVKFITFYLPGQRPTRQSATAAESMQQTVTPSQAAYNHVVRAGASRS